MNPIGTSMCYPVEADPSYFPHQATDRMSMIDYLVLLKLHLKLFQLFFFHT
jgi:hypothetical protein